MLMFLVAVAAATSLCTAPVPAPGDSLASLFDRGRTWDAFFAAANARKATWTENYREGAPDPAAVARGRAVSGRWRLLIVAEDWCGDSANTVPYLARLTEAVPGITLRIVDSKAGRWVMEGRRTGDGRAATPTIVVLDESGNEVGCLVERPAALKAWVDEHRSRLSDADFQSQRVGWYRDDRGRATVAEIVALVEAAARGTPIGCH